MSIKETSEISFDHELLFKFTDYYRDGSWNEDIPFISLCPQDSQCMLGDKYCGPLPDCRNRMRDFCFYRQFQYENSTLYYPSDCDIASWKDKRIIKLQSVLRKPYHYSGDHMISILDEAAEFNEINGIEDNNDNLNEALNEIRKFGYAINIFRFKIILKVYYFEYFQSKFK
jgi:hypothetical protein